MTSLVSQLNIFKKSELNISSIFEKKPVQGNEGDDDDIDYVSKSASSVPPSDIETGQQFATELDQGEKKLGLISCIGLICNRMLGTGVFAVSSTIYRLSGSVGLALIMWAVGAIIALAGLYVYMEF